MKVVALAGGVGGAKLVDGLAGVLPIGDLMVIVNTGDDFEHLGLTICPDFDTVLYTLAGLAHPERGWGRRDETWDFLATLGDFGGPTWFRLGDRDLALHAERTRRMQKGEPLSAVMRSLASALGVEVQVLPMSDQPVRTIVETDAGELGFQEYFVARACEPKVRGFHFEGAELASPAPGVREALEQADLVALCPSNPWVSLDPILAVPSIRPVVEGMPTIGVSPIVGGRAIKGPAAKMYEELGIEPSALAVADHYRGLLDALLIDTVDAKWADPIQRLGVQPFLTHTVMSSIESRKRLAQELLEFAADLEPVL